MRTKVHGGKNGSHVQVKMPARPVLNKGNISTSRPTLNRGKVTKGGRVGGCRNCK